MTKRKSKSRGNTVTVIEPRWQRNMRSWMKRARRGAVNVLAFVGFWAVLYVVVSRLAGG